MRLKSGSSPRSRSITRPRSFCRSERDRSRQAAIADQHRLVGAGAQQRIVNAGGAEFVNEGGGGGAAAVPAPSGVSRNRLSSVVLPAPRKPVSTVTGTLAPRARLSLRAERAGAPWKEISRS